MGCRYPGRGPEAAGLHKDRVGIHIDSRETSSQSVNIIPMGGGALPIQKTGLGQKEGCRTECSAAFEAGSVRTTPGHQRLLRAEDFLDPGGAAINTVSGASKPSRSCVASSDIAVSEGM